jgi:hypothetical protein
MSYIESAKIDSETEKPQIILGLLLFPECRKLLKASILGVTHLV